MADTSEGLRLIALERFRQVEDEGFTAEHDDAHVNAQLVAAARAYVQHALFQWWNESHGGWRRPKMPDSWPFEPQRWHPDDDPKVNLAKAGAMIAAEIDRIVRAEGR
jgi:hypothetical protein